MGETLLQRAIRTAIEAGLSPVIIVVRSTTNLALISEDSIELVLNSSPDEGIASSIRCGISALSSRTLEGTVIMTCDQPAVTASHLHALCVDKARITGSRYARTIGVPAYFPKRSFAELAQLRGDSGARTLLQAAHSIAAESLELDIDTQQDLDRARALFESNFHEAS